MITIVIPTLNEESQLRRVLPATADPAVVEVIVVDGGSQDRSCRVAQSHGAKVLEGTLGRGNQMALGALHAKSELLLFLHADTMPPLGFGQEIMTTMSDPSVVAGAFRLGIDERRASVLLIQHLANMRCRFFGSPYGDQGIFVRKSALDAIGGVPETPLLEDVLMVKRLKRLGKLAISKQSVLTSGRKWREHGTMKTTVANLSTCMGHKLGVNPNRLASWRSWLLPSGSAASQ